MKVIETEWKWKSGLSTRLSTKCIVLHHAAAKVCSPYQVDSWHKANGWSGIGYHFFIRKDGTIYRGRPEWAVGAHASGRNSDSIGVCVEGNYDEETIMPEKQKKAVKDVLSYLKAKYPNATIKGHREVGATGCPGKYYPMSEMVNYFNNESEGKPMTVEERTKFNELVNIVSELQISVDKLANPMIYNYIDNNMPEYARPTIQKLVDKGILQGDENGLGLTDDLLRVLVINDRAGLYD
jgi:hypothetical protein